MLDLAVGIRKNQHFALGARGLDGLQQVVDFLSGTVGRLTRNHDAGPFVQARSSDPDRLVVGAPGHHDQLEVRVVLLDQRPQVSIEFVIDALDRYDHRGGRCV